jgi:hypothetical protein
MLRNTISVINRVVFIRRLIDSLNDISAAEVMQIAVNAQT